MKYCEKCKKNFPDNQVFCSECGNKLRVAVSNNNVSRNSDDSSKIWQPVIFAAIGAVIGWFLSGLVGFIFGAVGVSMLRQQKKQGQNEILPSIITWILAVVDTIFWFIAMAA